MPVVCLHTREELSPNEWREHGMLQVSVEDTEIRPGKSHRWHLVPVSGDGPSAVRRMAGYNQVKHFTVAPARAERERAGPFLCRRDVRDRRAG
ncbi:hypothetical protein ACFVYD_19690 [Streptomyces sp. NPDC058301]|uniref:hypothetical protein n=1 Tax=Streptomyces sp. NPDC058301 TaxID=3346436 RepID=UPI0036EF3A60